MKAFTPTRAFTFIELLAVIAIVFLLWGVGFAFKAKIGDRKQEVIVAKDMEIIAEELERFHLENDYYPVAAYENHLPLVISEQVVLAQPDSEYEYVVKGDHYGLRTHNIYWKDSGMLFD